MSFNFRARRTSFMSGLEKYFEKSSITSYALAKLLQLEEAEKRLQESESLLARSQGPRYTLPSRSSQDCGFECVEAEPTSTSPIHGNGGCYILCLVSLRCLLLLLLF